MIFSYKLCVPCILFVLHVCSVDLLAPSIKGAEILLCCGFWNCAKLVWVVQQNQHVLHWSWWSWMFADRLILLQLFLPVFFSWQSSSQSNFNTQSKQLSKNKTECILFNYYKLLKLGLCLSHDCTCHLLSPSEEILSESINRIRLILLLAFKCFLEKAIKTRSWNQLYKVAASVEGITVLFVYMEHWEGRGSRARSTFCNPSFW